MNSKSDYKNIKTNSNQNFFVRTISYVETLNIRSLVLKPYLKPDECTNPGDFKSETFHLGVFVDDELACIGSFEQEIHTEIKNLNKDSVKTMFRLRGMATLPQFTRKGLGSLLIRNAENELQNMQVDLLWFNAREVAFPFYESLGYQFQGESFEIPRIGPHKVMYKHLSKL